MLRNEDDVKVMSDEGCIDVNEYFKHKYYCEDCISGGNVHEG